MMMMLLLLMMIIRVRPRQLILFRRTYAVHGIYCAMNCIFARHNNTFSYLYLVIT